MKKNTHDEGEFGIIKSLLSKSLVAFEASMEYTKIIILSKWSLP